MYNVQLYFVIIHFLFCSKSVLHPIDIWHWSNARDFFHLIFAHRASRLLDELCNDVSNRIHTVVIIQKERDSPGLNIKNFSNEGDPSFNSFTKLACPSKLRWKIEDWIFIQVNFDRLYNLKVFRANALKIILPAHSCPQFQMVDTSLTMHWWRGLYNKLMFSSDKCCWVEIRMGSD